MDWELIWKIVLAFIGIFAAATTVKIIIKVNVDKRGNKNKKDIKVKQTAIGNENIQAGRDINIDKEMK